MGIGRVLIAVYAVFAVSASARALYQLIREFDQAPLAYSLSAVAALVYLLATFALAKPKLRKLAFLLLLNNFFYSTAKRHGAHSAVACAEAVWVWAP